MGRAFIAATNLGGIRWKCRGRVDQENVLLNSRAVVVVGNPLGRRLMRPLRDLGLTPELETRFNKTLENVRKRPHAAIVMNESHVGIDALELALNVRDVDDEVPIIILCDKDEPPRLLAGVQKLRVFYLRGDVPASQLARRIKELLENLNDTSGLQDAAEPGRSDQR